MMENEEVKTKSEKFDTDTEGSNMWPLPQHEHLYTNKVFPLFGVGAVVLGIFLFGAGVGVLVAEQHYVAVSSVSYSAAPIVLLLGGITSVLAGGYLIFAINYREELAVRRDSLVFACTLIVASVFTIVAAIMAFVFIGQVGNKMQDDMNAKLKEYGITGKYQSLVLLNKIQSENKCCGVINYADWRNTTYGGHRYDKVPDSCCKVQDHACGFEFELTKINHGGCLKPVKGSTVGHLLIVGVGGLVVFLIEIALAIATFIIRKKHF
ncbi:tetraspanin-6-like [Montipora capricornis]|uniref:tetraspanin-6-like n=1 Tax=Montipora capricornis TaxID=246305 RepID=UPI0035F1260C